MKPVSIAPIIPSIKLISSVPNNHPPIAPPTITNNIN